MLGANLGSLMYGDVSVIITQLQTTPRLTPVKGTCTILEQSAINTGGGLNQFTGSTSPSESTMSHLYIYMYIYIKYIMQTRPCNLDPLTPHFYIEKLGFTGVYFFLCLLLHIDCGYSLEPPQ